jgi:hypothetical protein
MHIYTASWLINNFSVSKLELGHPSSPLRRRTVSKQRKNSGRVRFKQVQWDWKIEQAEEMREFEGQAHPEFWGRGQP